MRYAFMKLLFLAKTAIIIKKKVPSGMDGANDSHASRIMDILEGKTSQEIDKVKRQYENDFTNMMNENQQLLIELTDIKR